MCSESCVFLLNPFEHTGHTNGNSLLPCLQKCFLKLYLLLHITPQILHNISELALFGSWAVLLCLFKCDGLEYDFVHSSTLQIKGLWNLKMYDFYLENIEKLYLSIMFFNMKFQFVGSRKWGTATVNITNMNFFRSHF